MHIRIMLGKDLLAIARHRWVYLAVAFYTFGLLYVALHTSLISENEGTQKQTQDPSRVHFSSTIHELHDVFRHPITSPTLNLTSGDSFLLPFQNAEGYRFTSPLGKRLLILDVDTRPLNESGGLLNSTWSPNGGNLSATMGRLNHYFFARLHGYEYKFVQMTGLEGLFGTWSKVAAIKEQLHQYDFVVFVDADTIFPYPHVPLEWLFNYWEIVPDNLVTMAIDPAYPVNDDMYGRTLLNTGFIIAQQSPRTHELLEAWDNCPTDVKYHGCSRFSYDWPHEQGAFGNYLRYDFNRSDDVKVLSCMEANGCPEVTHLGCAGKLVRHYWGSKPSVPYAVQESIMQYFLSSLHKEFHQNYDQIFSTTISNYISRQDKDKSPAPDENVAADILQETSSETQFSVPEDLGEIHEASNQ